MMTPEQVIDVASERFEAGDEQSWDLLDDLGFCLQVIRRAHPKTNLEDIDSYAAIEWMARKVIDGSFAEIALEWS